MNSVDLESSTTLVAMANQTAAPAPSSGSTNSTQKMTRKELQKFKRKIRTAYGGGIMTLAMVFCVLSIMWTKMTATTESSSLTTLSSESNAVGQTDRRQLAQNMSLLPKCNELLTNYPAEAFTWEAKKNGAVALYIFGVLYMFVALAIVCDEFFVPALECIVDAAGISDDVAGATFMAAGGSAPELFTSFMGVFASGSDVGFGTIIGSAVFNVLFVIGMCAMFSKELLTLTWWPLFRDCTYYLISLIVLAVFFGVDYGNGTPSNMIEWWESLILFLMYCGYVTVMKFNVKLERGCKRNFCKQKDNGNTAIVPTADQNNFIRTSTSITPDDQNKMKEQEIKASFLRPCKFRAGVLHLMLNQTPNSTIVQRARTFVVADLIGDFKQTFAQIDTNGDGAIDKDELCELLKELTGTPPTKDELIEGFNDMVGDNKDGEITLMMFKEWYADSEARVSKQAHDAFDQIDEDNSGDINEKELQKVLRTLSEAQHPELTGDELHKKTVSDVKKVLETFGHVASAEGEKQAVFTITFDEFMKWYKDSILFKEQLEKNAATENERKSQMNENNGGEEPISLAFPDTTGARIMYIVTFPIMILLVMTVPDVRNKNRKKYFPISFIMAILWIAVYSYLMVWWATIIGLVAGIPDTVMGLTFLAAGTSIPDLLTSVIVARQGLGDMAVSSSIGSNIFDILVGLPVPWLVYSAAFNGKAMQVYSDSLLVSVVTLVGMLMAVIVTIALCKWSLSKMLGATMFFLYGAFVASDLARANWDIACNTVD